MSTDDGKAEVPTDKGETRRQPVFLLPAVVTALCLAMVAIGTAVLLGLAR